MNVCSIVSGLLHRVQFVVHGINMPLSLSHVFTGNVFVCNLKKNDFIDPLTVIFFTLFSTSCPGPLLFSDLYNGVGIITAIMSLYSLFLGTRLKYSS